MSGSKFESTVFADQKNVNKEINCSRFKSYDEIDGSVYEIKIKTKIVHNGPINFGFAVLNN